jgi:hypothetical protein
MPKLAEELVHVEDLPFLIDDMDNTFKPNAPLWCYVWYRLQGNNEEVLFVAYDSREELLRKEKDR